MYQNFHNRTGLLAPNPEIWLALENGAGLNEILKSFYTLVYADEQLSIFFEDITIQRAIEKQSSFLRSVFTGEKCYFGEHPKKAHHWMVISDALYDYREELMEQCLREYGLTENLITQWRAMEEVFRKAIVKSKPINTMINGVKKLTEGYKIEKLEVASLCDGCTLELKSNQYLTCHVRTGKIYCDDCTKKRNIKLL
ncbi:hypothetical protein MNBD_GAMMA22-2206 [hydrothermal vent metagenome]|uniref:Uncharacterized protein n=1 Tax=hydrothermal vent metagenome TaxID=652676 RepID=A0A3B0ZYG1_9ZZZZ